MEFHQLVMLHGGLCAASLWFAADLKGRTVRTLVGILICGVAIFSFPLTQL